MTEKLRQAQALVKAIDDHLITRYALTGVGVGLKVVNGVVTDKPCIKMFVATKIPKEQVAPIVQIPRALSQLGGEQHGRTLEDSDIETDVEEMPPMTSPPYRDPDTEHEQFRTLSAEPKRIRPVQGGQSVSHALGTLGTVTAIVTDPYDEGRDAILSCNHVLGQLNHALYGDAVVQPARDDGGTIGHDLCAYLTRYMPIYFSQTIPNYCDAAIARVIASPAKLRSLVPGFGEVKGIRSGNTLVPGETVYKVGRTTGVSQGTVIATHVSTWVNYPAILNGNPLNYALYKEQIVTTGMAGFGDSGSLVMDEQKRAVGMLFGGSKTRTLVSDIELVQRSLGIKLHVAAMTAR